MLHDTIWVTDGNLRRTNLYRLDGSVISTQPWQFEDAAIAVSTGRGRSFLQGLFADGTGWGESDGHTMTMLRGGPELPKAVVRMSRSGRTLDTIASVPTSHSMFSVLFDGGMQFGQQRFADGALVIGVPSLSHLYVVRREAATNEGSGYVRVLALSATGDTLWARELPYAPRKLEKASADSFSNQMQTSLQRSGASVEAIRRALCIPQFRPPVSQGFASEDGMLWIRREEGRATVDYWVMTRDGTLTASTTVPTALTLTAARGEQVWGEEKDADGVPFVVRFRIAK